MNGLLSLRDGRQLQWADNGIESDSALIFHNGTTVALDVWGAWFEDAAAQNVRAIGINRPGIGKSTPHHGRKIKDDVDDAREVITALEVKNFVSVGWSGGGGRALGSSLIEGCRAVHTIAGISPIDLNDEASISWMSPERRASTAMYLSDFEEIVKDRSAQFEDDLKLTHDVLLRVIKSVPNFASNEVEYIKFSHDLYNSVAPTLVNGPATDCEDYLANISPWGFSLEQIKVPVTIWHGVDDDDVFFARGEYLHAKLLQSEFIAFEDQGHVTIMLEKRSEILASALKDLHMG